MVVENAALIELGASTLTEHGQVLGKERIMQLYKEYLRAVAR